MKKLTLYIMTAFLLLSLTPMQLNAATAASTTPVTTKTVEPLEVKTLTARLDEINAMDKSKMGSHEKKQLRKEVRSIKSQLKRVSGGVYLSAGAIIIILLLVILLL
ncbi:MAG: hypothetical protein KA165_01840 [Saprospiraceae bacterium]|nr:hypothetical protein [Saprospiraceae bacterium]